MPRAWTEMRLIASFMRCIECRRLRRACREHQVKEKVRARPRATPRHVANYHATL
ncbi:hypothetical protein [Paraburkholderia sp. BR14374]|uniref:hypothetical protein n=1 Tax=Paraburkholderia sp. BR14374 TaxID=3237007 RepID=UPI0034CD7BDA